MHLFSKQGLVSLLATVGLSATVAHAVELQRNEVVKETLGIIYSGDETLHYAVSWSGGVKIGDIYMQIREQQPPEQPERTYAKAGQQRKRNQRPAW